LSLSTNIEESIDEVLFSSVIEACIRVKQMDLVSELMKRYRQRGGFVNLSAPTYGSMIKAYGQAGNLQRVQELWVEMQEQGVKPTSITLGCLTEALVVNNKAQEAWTLARQQMEDEERRGCINTVIYSTVLKGFAVSKCVEKVFQVYKEMRASGISCNTTTSTRCLTLAPSLAPWDEPPSCWRTWRRLVWSRTSSRTRRSSRVIASRVTWTGPSTSWQR
jgi:pentatricopeptide repeat protein